MNHPNELDQQIDNLRTLQESYDQIAGAAEAYNTGKVQLAENITSKGVEASATETLPELAGKVAAISQETYEIDGGEMYAKQLFGSLETPNYWNLYDILAQLLSDGRLVSYGGILLAEYYRGYDSLALAGAGAGGAYVVSDLDENGQFKMYTEDTTHVWATEFDGKGNRWVAYCFADEYHDFQITDTNTSPRSIFIGRKVGTITSLVAGRISQIVVPDGNELISFNSGTFNQNWAPIIIMRNINIGGSLYNSQDKTFNGIYIKANERITGGNFRGTIESLILEAPAINGHVFTQNGSVVAKTIIVKAEEIQCTLFITISGSFTGQDVYILGCEKLTTDNSNYFFIYNTSTIKYIYIGYKENDKSRSIDLSGSTSSNNSSIKDVELEDGWCKPLNIRRYIGLTKENVQAHIFDRLGVNDLSTGAVTITLATAVLNLFTQEEIDAVVARTNITIVGA